MSIEPLTRRSAMAGGLVAVVAALAGYVVARNSSVAKPRSATAAANGYGPVAASGGARLAALAAVPAAGGLILDKADVVLVRDQQDGVRAFSATCTHQGCVVGSVQGDSILCPCHGSAFSTTDGKVLAGPATRPLPEVAVVVRDGGVFTAQ